MTLDTPTKSAIAVDPAHELMILPADDLVVEESSAAEAPEDRKPAEKDEPSRGKKFLKNCIFWLVIIAIGLGIWFSGLMVSVVKTGSMRPGIQPGDLVVSISSKIVKPEMGSIVVAEPVVAGSKLPAIAHRVIAINPDGTYITQGDYNPEPDAWRDRPEDITSVVLFKVPMGWSRSPVTIAAGMGLLALIFVWPKGKKDEQVEQAEIADEAASDAESDAEGVEGIEGAEGEAEVDLRDQEDQAQLKV